MMLMKTKVLIMALATLLFSSCWKSYFADRPPKKWNNDYSTPEYIYDNRNTIAMGDTVMAIGWLLDTNRNGSWFCISSDSGYLSNGIAGNMHRKELDIRKTICEPFLLNNLHFDFPAQPSKVYVTGRFYHIADECHCDWAYYLVPMTENDVVFEPINTEL